MSHRIFNSIEGAVDSSGVRYAKIVGPVDIITADGGSLKINGSALAGAELGFIDGAIAGTGVASKALVLSSTLTASISGSGAGAFLTAAPGTTGAGLKIHTHSNVNNSGGTYDYTYMNEFKGEFVSTSGTMVGVGADYTLSGSGTGAMCASSGYAKLLTGITMSGAAMPTAGVLTGGQFFANVAGTVSGAGCAVMGLYGGIDYNTGGTLTTCDYITGIQGEYRSNIDCGTGTSSILRLVKGGTASTAVDYGIYMLASNGTITTGIYLPACTTGIQIEGATTTAIGFGVGDGKIVDAAASLSIYGGNTSGDALVLFGSSADAGQKITITGASGTAVTGTLSVTAGITMAGGTSYNPIHIGTKSNSADAGLILTGVTDDTGGIMVFCDDGGDALGSITSPIWTRYLITKTDQSSGATATGAYLQMKTLTGMTMNTGSYTAAKIFNQIGGTLTLTNGGECAIVNAAMSLEGNITNTSGRISGIDININGAYTITDSIADSAALHIRKVSGSTAVWPVGIKINDSSATTGIVIGTSTTGISLSGTYTTGTSIEATVLAAGKAEYVNCTVVAPTKADGYGYMERQVTVTGTAVGPFALTSNWINFNASSSAGTNNVYLYNDGFWASATGTPCNTATLIAHRIQFNCTNLKPAAAYLFQVNPYNISLDAIFTGNDKADYGWVTGELSSGDCHFPFIKIGSTTYYVNCYTS